MGGPFLSAVVAVLALAASSAAQEYKGKVCREGTPYCWVPIETHKNCELACMENKDGPQNLPVNAGDYTGPLAHTEVFEHWVCRAKGDQGEGWRSGFQLRSYNDGTRANTSCNLGAHGQEISQEFFECMCTQPFPFMDEPDIVASMSFGWIVAIMAAASFGACIAVLGIHLFQSRYASQGRYGSVDHEISDLRHMKIPLAPEGL
jgi:hypothetical protein